MVFPSCFFLVLGLLLVGTGSSTSSDLELDERKSNSSSEDPTVFLEISRRFALRAEGLVSSASFFAATNVVLPKSSQSFPEPMFGVEVRDQLPKLALNGRQSFRVKST